MIESFWLRMQVVSRSPVVELDDALYDWRRLGITVEGAELGAGGRLAAVGVRPAGVDQAVAVVDSTAEPASVGRHGQHGRAGPVLDPASLGLGETAEDAHDQVVGLAVGIDPPADLRHPQLDAVVAQGNKWSPR